MCHIFNLNVCNNSTTPSYTVTCATYSILTFVTITPPLAMHVDAIDLSSINEVCVVIDLYATVLHYSVYCLCTISMYWVFF